MPERSFFFHGYQFPLCARCTGIAIGYILGIIFILLGIHLKMFLCVTFFLLCAADGTVQHYTSYTSTNIRRFILGLLCGISLMQFLYVLILAALNNLQ